jgi:hypothetical protein
MKGIQKYLKGKKIILDVGTGPNGSGWWELADSDSEIISIDTLHFPKTFPDNVKIYNYDANELRKINKNQKLEQVFKNNRRIDTQVGWHQKFDMVVLNHVLEHVKSPRDVVRGIEKVALANAIVYVGFPDSNNFTDIFYHLIHPNSGGHIQLLTDKSVEDIFLKSGFKLESKSVWPDDWLWFEKLYNWKNYMWADNKFLTQQKIEYLASVFRRELTAKKGYYYGWEMIFKKD